MKSLMAKKVLYIKTSIKNGVTTEMWYSLTYLVPLKFSEVMIEDNERSMVNWSVIEIDTTPMNDDELFYIPEDAKENSGSSDDYYDDIPVTGSARDILLYEVNTITVEEKGIDDMTQIFLLFRCEL